MQVVVVMVVMCEEIYGNEISADFTNWCLVVVVVNGWRLMLAKCFWLRGALIGQGEHASIRCEWGSEVSKPNQGFGFR